MRSTMPSPGTLSRFVAVVLACLTIATFTVPVTAWSARGHQLMAFIAFQHLNSAAKAKVSELLARNPQFDHWMDSVPSRASDERKALTPFLEASNCHRGFRVSNGHLECAPFAEVEAVIFGRAQPTGWQEFCAKAGLSGSIRELMALDSVSGAV